MTMNIPNPASQPDETTSRYHFLTDLEAQAIPPAKWMVDGILLEETLAILAAPGESGKTLMMLDMCLCIATGTAWHGHKVKRGAIAYISAEGKRGFGKRLRAWKLHHDIPINQSLPLYPLFEAVPLLDMQRQAELHLALEKLPEKPSMVVIDTLSQCTTGVDENTAAMASAIAAADRIKTQFGCAVAILHHSTKDGEKMRGHSSLRDNVDTQILLVKDEITKTVTVKCGKQRDEDHFNPFTLQFKKVYLDEAGDESSAVLVDSNTAPMVKPEMTQGQRQALTTLASFKDGATSTIWQNASGLTDTVFKDALRFLKGKNYVYGGGGKGTPYFVADWVGLGRIGSSGPNVAPIIGSDWGCVSLETPQSDPIPTPRVDTQFVAPNVPCERCGTRKWGLNKNTGDIICITCHPDLANLPDHKATTRSSANTDRYFDLIPPVKSA